MKYVCFVLYVGKELISLFDMEIIRILLFVIKVLLVEGISDKEVV